MTLFSIDESKCKKDGICVAECPACLIEMKTPDSNPTPIQGAENLCIKCGHCVAVCPHAALTLNFMSPSNCAEVIKSELPSAEQVELLMKSRRSIRTYRDKPVDRATLERLIEIARHAPSGHNSQPVSWRVYESREELHRLVGITVDWMRFMVKNAPQIAAMMHFDLVISAWERGKDRILRGAPNLVIAHAPADLMPAQAACIIALTYMELHAASLGLGTCWAGYFNAAATMYQPMKDALELPPGHQSFGALMMGYPKYPYKRVPARNIPAVSWK